MVFRLDASRISLIGAGAAGSALTRALYETGLTVDQILSRTLASAVRLARDVGAEHASDRLSDVEDAADLTVVAVPDDRIEAVACDLAALSVSWRGRVVMHLSGSRASTALKPLQDRGAEVMSFHPMLPLHRHLGLAAFDRARVNIEGTPTAVEAGKQIAERVGAIPYVVDPDSKSAIHLAASVASNFLVTLMSLAADVLSASDISADDYESLLRPLVMGTIDNLDFGNAAAALTGPISRGDEATLEAQFELLGRLRPELVTVFADLAAETVRIATRSEKLSDLEAVSMLDQISRYIERPIPGD